MNAIPNLPTALIAGFLAILVFPGFSPAVDYETEVLAVFKAKCYKCHGDGKAKAGVALDPDRVAREVGDVIVAGDAEKSDLFISVTTEDKDDLMPPPGKGSPLTANEIKALREWIDAGAVVPGHDAPATAEETESDSLFANRPEPIKGEWTNKAGKSISATLLRVEGDKAVLEMTGGKLYNYPIADLSDESQAIVRDFASKSNE